MTENARYAKNKKNYLKSYNFSSAEIQLWESQVLEMAVEIPSTQGFMPGLLRTSKYGYKQLPLELRALIVSY